MKWWQDFLICLSYFSFLLIFFSLHFQQIEETFRFCVVRISFCQAKGELISGEMEFCRWTARNR